MAAENQELLSRISHLAGQINLHKGKQQRQDPPASSSYSYVASGNRPHYDPYYGRSRGYAGKYSTRPGGFRNRSLVLKRSEKAESRDGADESGSAEHSDNAGQSSWVQKRDRHLQLISTAHYDASSKSSGTTTPSNSEPRGEGERDGQLDGATNQQQEQKPKKDSTDPHHLLIEGIAFQVSDGGSKLVREKDQKTEAEATPETAVVGGIEFRRDHNGDMRRMDTKSSRTPCKRFSNTGECSLGPRCAYAHDPSKVAVCREFLRLGTCKDGPQCNLSHECSYERVPACSHFQRGKCTKTDCRYAHIHVNPTAPVCREFSALGYCGRGSACQERHVFECPDYSSTGKCRNPNCRLPHIDRASQLRQQDRQDHGHLSDRAPPSDQQMVIDTEHPSSDEEVEYTTPEGSKEPVELMEADPASDRALDSEHNFIWL